jgi:hypothetical protein
MIMCTTWAFSQVSFEISPREVPLNRNLIFKVIIEGGNSRTPTFPGGLKSQSFKLISRSPNTSSSTTIVNGKMSSKKEFTYFFQPRKMGSYVFEKQTVNIDGKTYTSPQVKIQVTKAETRIQSAQRQRRRSSIFDDFFNSSPFDRQPRSRSARDPEIFAEVYTPKKTYYQGEAIPIEVRLIFYGVDILSQGSRMDWPQMTDFWIEENNSPNQNGTRVERGGKYYNASVVGKRTVYANKSGQLSIDPVTFELRVSTGGFFGDQQQVHRESKPIKLNILPLPDKGKPTDFHGAVGVFKLNAELDKTELSVGDTLSLKLTLSGDGNFSAIQNIVLKDFKEHFDVFDSGVPQTDEVDGKIVKKTWAFALVPKNEGSYEIPPVSFSFFDLSKKKYTVLQTKKYAVTVNPGSRLPEQISQNDGTRKQPLEHEDRSLKFIKFEEEGWRDQTRKYASPKTLYVIAGLGFLLNILFLIGVRMRESWLGKQEHMRPQLALKVFNKEVKSLQKQHIESNRDFFSKLSSLLMGYFGAKLDRPAQGLLLDELERIFEKKGAPEDLYNELVDCVESCDYARFTSSGQTSREKLVEQTIRVVQRAEEVLK